MPAGATVSFRVRVLSGSTITSNGAWTGTVHVDSVSW